MAQFVGKRETAPGGCYALFQVYGKRILERDESRFNRRSTLRVDPYPNTFPSDDTCHVDRKPSIRVEFARGNFRSRGK
jgi:hypothetical protein